MIFSSFWQAGFEGACHVNAHGERLDLIAATQHDVQALDDYRRVANRELSTVRDSVRWPLIDRAQGMSYDSSSFLPMLRASVQTGVQVIWTLCHYGVPDGLDVFAPAFVDRFARYAAFVAHIVREESDTAAVYAPINEISFFAWAAGDNGGPIHPHARGRGVELKRNLARASLAAIDAIRSVEPRARFLIADPVIHVVAPRGREDLVAPAHRQTETAFEAWDMLRGDAAPELGGRPSYLDIVGANFYHSNQWEFENGRLRWEDTPRDERWVPLRQLLAALHARYGRPIVLAETSHFGAGRARWIREIGEEVAAAIRMGVPMEGVCVFPIIDRMDWEDAAHWHNSGLWDVRHEPDGRLRRVLNAEYAAALREAQKAVADAQAWLRSAESSAAAQPDRLLTTPNPPLG